MPKITNKKVLEVLQDPYFDHHAAMHLARERLELASGKKVPLILNPNDKCDCCSAMIPAGDPGSGKQFLDMHHEMIRVFRFLLQKAGVQLVAKWQKDHWDQPEPPAGTGYYRPVPWNLDDPTQLPQDVVGAFSETDPTYLKQVFDGVAAKVKGAGASAIDDLGQFIERGVDPGEKVDGHGFHNTLHEYLGAREGKAAAGAEMNKLRNSMFNDYFWSLHLWIDGQYARLLQYLGVSTADFDAPLDPQDAMCGTKKGADHSKMGQAGMTMGMPAGSKP